ncbi:MAG: PEP/pyruvate-binding domain-containing protein, partial [Acidobacteriota bacterium]
PNLPVVLLAFDEADLRHFPDGPPAVFDHVFLWTGDAQILIAAIKLVEDAKNAAEDTRCAGVQVIVVVEDSLRRYSTFLALLYAELMTQARSLISEGLNTLHRTLRMRARPKIVLATSFEEALGCLRGYGDNLMALISDVRFPRGGREDPEAGFDLVKLVRADHADLPILLQSAEPEVERRAAALQVSWANKNSPTLLDQIRHFLKDGLGFGDFVFRLPDRTEVGRARDLGEFWQVLKTVPAESVGFHASRNHFSMWCNARGRFELSAHMRPRKASEFESVEKIRAYLLEVVGQELQHEQEGVIADFTRQMKGPEKRFLRIGGGSVGGKGRGIAFVHSVAARQSLEGRFPELPIRIPKTIVLGTDLFDRFLGDNGLALDRLATMDDRAITEAFLAGRLDDRLARDLEVAFKDLAGPVAVRSSSLLEDSRFQPFAGIYATVMLPNALPDARDRFRELCRAIAAVYASTYSRDARSYFAGTPHSVEEEKMAVVIQEMVGESHEGRFYPAIAGVAQSYNYYPVGGQQA